MRRCCLPAARPLPAAGQRAVAGLAALDVVAFALALLSAALAGDSGGRLLGAPVGAVYVLLGLTAIVLAGAGSVVAGAVLARKSAACGNAAGRELDVPLLPAGNRDDAGRSGSGGGVDLSAGAESAPSAEGSLVGATGPAASTGLLSCLIIQDFDQAKRLAELDHSISMRRQAGFTAAYVCVTAVSFGLGIEAVDLRDTGAAPSREGVACMAAAIASLQAAFFLTKQLLAQAQEIPEASLDLRAVHPHPLHLAVHAHYRSCDICGESIEAGEAFQCVFCNFDYCLACFKKGKKLQDWGLLRGDKGVKVPERARTMPITAFFCRALRLLAAYRGHVVATGLLLLFNVTCRLLVPNLEGQLFDHLIHQHADEFTRQLRFLMAYWVAQTVFQSVQRLVTRLLSRNLRLDLRLRLFERLLSQDIAFFDATRSGAMAQRLDGDVEDMSRPVPVLINSLLQSAVLIVGALVCCLLASGRLTVLSAACLGPMTYLAKVSAEWSSELWSQMAACEEEGSAVVTEAMTNIRHVRAFSAEEHELGRYRRILSRLFGKTYKDALGDLVVENLQESLEFLVELLVLFFGGLAIVDGHEEALTVGGLIAFTMYWDMLRGGVQTIQDMFSELAQAAGAAQRVFDLLDISPDIPLAEGQVLDRETFAGRICFEGVQFTYQSRPDKPVLHGVDLEVPAGGVCALVGRSGAGKSTLVHLLLRFYDPQRGRITVDGVPLTDVNLRSLHGLIGFVGQETKLSYGSIRDNLTYGLPWGAPDEGEMEAAAEAANCAEFISEMEDGYDSKVGEAGVKLSGGQKQRLAIARAFLRRPRLLVLDEATSHLDAENEQQVQAAIDRLIQRAKPGEGGPGGCTVILIAHRLSTVRDADVIAVINDGRVAEQGTHDTLLKLEGGIYAKLVAKQAERAANILPEDGAAGPAERSGADVDGLFDSVLGHRPASERSSSEEEEESDESGSDSGSDSSSESGSTPNGAADRSPGKPWGPEAARRIAALEARIAELESRARRAAGAEANGAGEGGSTGSSEGDSSEEGSGSEDEGGDTRGAARKGGSRAAAVGRGALARKRLAKPKGSARARKATAKAKGKAKDAEREGASEPVLD